MDASKLCREIPAPQDDEFREVAWAKTSPSSKHMPIFINRGKADTPKSKYVQFELLYSGICHSDIHSGENDFGSCRFVNNTHTQNPNLFHTTNSFNAGTLSLEVTSCLAKLWPSAKKCPSSKLATLLGLAATLTRASTAHRAIITMSNTATPA